MIVPAHNEGPNFRVLRSQLRTILRVPEGGAEGSDS